jgi:PHD/YefM family antitoxin component YafN of YafNO toxin-antitoxin module
MKAVGSREFNQDVSRAKRAALDEPVFITDRGKATHVLLSIDAYRRLVGKPQTLPDLLAAAHPIDLEPDWHAVGPWPRKSSS